MGGRNGSMAKASEKQIEYAKAIADLLGTELPESNDKFAVGAFIAKHKEEAQIRQREINEEIYNRIKSEVQIVDIAKEMGFTVGRIGRYYQLAEHDSVRINADTNSFVRYSNDHKGSVIDFVQEFQDIGRTEAIRQLAERLQGVPIGQVSPRKLDVKEKEAKEFVLPERSKNMRNVYAYLMQSRYLDQDVVQDMVNRENIYQDIHKNCVFVSYREEKPVFACLKGTNTFVPFEGDLVGCDYTQGWFISNQSDKLYIAEAPIDAMSRMSMLKAVGKDYKAYDYCAICSTAKYNTALDHLKSGKYKEVILGVDNDEKGLQAVAKIEAGAVKIDPSIKITRDLPKLTKDWNDELKYVFTKSWRFENYFLPNQGQRQIISCQLEALAKADTQSYSALLKNYDRLGIPGELHDYMLNYLEHKFDAVMDDIKNGKPDSINKILNNYNKQIKLKPNSPKLTVKKALDVEL